MSQSPSEKDLESRPGSSCAPSQAPDLPPDFYRSREDTTSYHVVFDGPEDPRSPYNWTTASKLYTSMIVCAGTLVVSFDSAIYASSIPAVSSDFHISTEVAQLGTSLFVVGFACGPLIWGPASELIGRAWPLRISMLGTTLFTLSCATAKDAPTLIICRFFAGVFGASPFCVVPGVLSDLYTHTSRGVSIALYSFTIFGGPLLGPVIGSFVARSCLGWRWTQYIPTILGFFDTALIFFTLRETFAPIVLAHKAAQLRKTTGNWAYYASHERTDFEFQQMVRKYFSRPLTMLVTEPMVLLVTLYMSFIYGIVYAFLTAYPYVFEHTYGMRPGVADLPFLGILLGVCFAMAFVLIQQRGIARRLAANDEKMVPEWRLPPAIVGAVVFPVGLFWFAWTAFTPRIHWMVPTTSGVAIGFGVLCIWIPCFNYLVDAYLPIAASAVAANIILRSAIAAGFPLFAKQMFAKLGVQWAGTLLGCIAVVLMPIPLCFRIYGPRLRRKSRFLT